MDNVENEVLARGNPNQVESEWSKPPMGWIKINCDGAYYEKSNSAASAAVAHNHEGIPLTGAAARLTVSSALAAEACAVRRAATITLNEGYREVIIESDLNALVHSLNQGSTATTREIEAIQQDIWHYVKDITKVIFKHTRRSGNSAAHTLAMHSRQGTLPFDWLHSPPR
ncbi:unnamed protein product [Ilex paraguariensis]|uniref:RNase H type-1 domain-containing protein n=1 Tax=Ilex paraguariensis TaxID=185542 RepID=A0ABC8R2E7_9AQUA